MTALPVHDSLRTPDAEGLLLSTILFKPDLAAKYAPQVEPGLFHDAVWHAMARHALSAIRAHGECSPPLVGEAVRVELDKDAGEISNLLNELAEWSFFPEGHTVQALQLLRDRANRETIQTRLRSAVHEADSNTVSNAEILADLDQLTVTVRSKTIERLSTLADTLITDPADERGEAIPTGISWFDVAMPGGSLQRSDKLAVAGPPGIGKTALMLQLTVAAVTTNPDLNAVWCLGEMSERQIRNRTLSNLSGLPSDVLRRAPGELSPLQAQGKAEATEVVREIGQRFHFVKAPLTPSAIETAILTTEARWVVIDYLQLCRPDKGGTSRRDEIDSVIREFTRIAQAHGVVLLIISDMPKGGQRDRDIFDAFKESSEIPYAADLAYVGERIGSDDPDDQPDEVDIRWRCLKARNGQPRSFTTRFRRYAQQFEGGAW